MKQEKSDSALTPRDEKQTDLLPCPFCGVPMYIENTGRAKPYGVDMRHPKNDCLLSGYGWGAQINSHAERWNRRAEKTEAPASRGKATTKAHEDHKP